MTAEDDGGTRPVTSFEELLARLQGAQAQRIGVDGLPGAGKTTLAKEIAAALKLPHLELDTYLLESRPKGGGAGYLQALDYPRLSTDACSPVGWVIEGVCLLEVVARLELRVDLHIYCDPPDHPNRRTREQGRDRYMSVEDCIRQEISLECSPCILWKEIGGYHDDRHPQDRADILFRRSSSAPR